MTGRMPGLTDHETFVRLSRSRDYLAAYFDQRVLLDEAARQAYLSKYHYQRLFQRTFGETPHEFLTRRRIDRARDLLASTDLSVSEICMDVGYSSLGSFSARFHQLVGCPPSEFRARLRGIFAIPWPGMHHFLPNCFLRFYGLEPAVRNIATFEKRS
jgi:AraC-like DNA-binding protein